jgi:predicted HTH transcriptional regulator
MEKNTIRNAALLLFAYEPQKFFINSEIRCARFYGNIVEKPIPSYKVFKGNVFELIDQSVDFVLSKLDYRVETRAQHNSIPGKYEIPPEIITEAIVNAVAHRDYTSNASIQVMIFRDRIEIWNPGMLPIGWSTDKLKETHPSIPGNPLLAEPMYLAGYIERMGTGTSDMIRYAKNAGLQEPSFIQEDDFKTIIFRINSTKTSIATDQVTDQATDQVTDQVSEEVRRLLFTLKKEMSRSEIQDLLSLKHSANFRYNYIIPALEQGLIEMTIPDNLNNPNQKYKLSKQGKKLISLKFSGDQQQNSDQATDQATDQVSDQVSDEIKRLIFGLNGEMKRSEIQTLLHLKHSGNFRNNYILPALERGLIEMTIPESPNSPNQKYTLTTLGNRLKTQLKKVK